MYIILFALLNVQITHTPPNNIFMDAPLQIFAEVSEEVEMAYVLINEKMVYMQKEQTHLSATIPYEFVESPSIKYCIVVKTKDNKIVKSPEYKVSVIIRDNLIELVSPEPYSSITTKKPDIVIVFSNEVNPKDITVFLDSVNITSNCENTSFSIYYTPRANLRIGQHQLKVKIKDITETTFSFNITSKISAHGYASAGARYTTSKDSVTSSLPYEPGIHPLFDTYINGSLYFPFSFWFNMDEGYNFNFEMEYPRGKLSVGDIYTTSSMFTLYGILPRGLNLTTSSTFMNIDLLCAQVEKSDTNYLTYARYILGGKISRKILNASLGISYYYGLDDSTVLTTLSDTSLNRLMYEPPIKNNFFTGEVKYPFLEQLIGIIEFSKSSSQYPDSALKEGYAYNAGIELTTDYIDNKLTYNNIDTSYFIIGNPYLDAGKNGVLDEFSIQYKNLYLNGNYEIYKISDSTEYMLYNYLNYTFGKFTPYIIYSNTFGLSSTSSGVRFGFSRGYASSSYGITSSGNSFRADAECEFIKNRFSLKTGYGHNNSSTSFNWTSDIRMEVYKFITLEYKIMNNVNEYDSTYSYNENIITLRLKKQF
ncbi:MAG: hypothetical protein PHE49_01635 [bacterium]|nr:hypothetical protein [bacterium]